MRGLCPALAISGGAAIADTNKLVIDGGIVQVTDTEIVSSLYFGAVQQVSGTWGSTLSTATYKDDTRFVGTGVLSVTTGPVIGFGIWITGFGLTPAQQDPAADPDGDGQNNITEFALDGNPASGAATGKGVGKTASVSGSPTLVLTLPVRAGATFTAPGAPANSQLVSAAVDGVVYQIQGGNDLVTWTQAVSEVTGSDKTTIETGLPALSGIGWTYRTFSSPGSVSGNPKEFLRAVIVAQP